MVIEGGIEGPPSHAKKTFLNKKQVLEFLQISPSSNTPCHHIHLSLCDDITRFGRKHLLRKHTSRKKYRKTHSLERRLMNVETLRKMQSLIFANSS